MVSRIIWEDEGRKTRKLFHFVDRTWNDEGNIFEWKHQFGNQAKIMITDLLPYLKSLYGDLVESYLSPGAISIQSKQRWNKEK